MLKQVLSTFTLHLPRNICVHQQESAACTSLACHDLTLHGLP